MSFQPDPSDFGGVRTSTSVGAAAGRTRISGVGIVGGIGGVAGACIVLALVLVANGVLPGQTVEQRIAADSRVSSVEYNSRGIGGPYFRIHLLLTVPDSEAKDVACNVVRPALR